MLYIKHARNIFKPKRVTAKQIATVGWVLGMEANVKITTYSLFSVLLVIMLAGFAGAASCGNGQCENVIPMVICEGENCPIPESYENCPQDCPVPASVTCSNGLRDSNEAGVDCGGPCKLSGVVDDCDGKDNDKDCLIDEGISCSDAGGGSGGGPVGGSGGGGSATSHMQPLLTSSNVGKVVSSVKSVKVTNEAGGSNLGVTIAEATGGGSAQSIQAEIAESSGSASEEDASPSGGIATLPTAKEAIAAVSVENVVPVEKSAPAQPAVASEGETVVQSTVHKESLIGKLLSIFGRKEKDSAEAALGKIEVTESANKTQKLVEQQPELETKERGFIGWIFGLFR